MAAFYDDLIFPESISLSGFKGKRQRLTTVVEVQSGFDQRRSLWAITKRSYDAGLVTRPADQWRLIDDFFEICEGQAIGFLLKDPTDYQVDQAHGLLAAVAGDVYSLQKVRVVGSHSAYRAIGKPRASTVVVWRMRAGVTSLVSTTNYTVDAVNGTVTFNVGFVVAGDTFAWAGEFYVPVRFTTDDLDWETVDKQAFGQLLIQGPSIPITEDPQEGLLHLPPT